MKNKIKICFLVRVPFAVLHKEYISGKLPKCFSQFRLHFRLCLGSCVEKASCLPWDGAQVGLTSISFMILFETSQSHETPPYPYLMPHPYLGLYCTATSMLHHWWWCYPLCTLQHKTQVWGVGLGHALENWGQRFLLFIFCTLICTGFNTELDSSWGSGR